ncbi:MAG: hypothetical protein ACRC92_04235 [Peptostreptococcaceae bacterium]
MSQQRTKNYYSNDEGNNKTFHSSNINLNLLAPNTSIYNTLSLVDEDFDLDAISAGEIGTVSDFMLINRNLKVALESELKKYNGNEGGRVQSVVAFYRGGHHNLLLVRDTESRILGSVLLKGCLLQNKVMIYFLDKNFTDVIHFQLDVNAEASVNFVVEAIAEVFCDKESEQYRILSTQSWVDIEFLTKEVQRDILYNYIKNITGKNYVCKYPKHRFIAPITDNNECVQFIDDTMKLVSLDTYERPTLDALYDYRHKVCTSTPEDIDESFFIAYAEDSDIAYKGAIYHEKFSEVECTYHTDSHMFLELEMDIVASKAGRKLSSIPKGAYEGFKRFSSKARGIVKGYRRYRDDRLREKLINDEIIPFFDEIFEWLFTGVLTYGSTFVTFINPVMSLVIFLVTKTIMNVRTKARKEIALSVLKQEIAICEEKINDARIANNNQAKYALMRIRDELSRKLDMIRYDNRLR